MPYLLLLTPLLLLPAEPSWGPYEVDAETDLDLDGVAEWQVSWSSGGSGFWSGGRCLVHLASQHVACETWSGTAYSPFTSLVLTRSPEEDERALALLDPSCTQDEADPEDPTQGSLWALQQSVTPAGALSPAPRWHPGAPVEQRRVCLSPGGPWHGPQHEPEGARPVRPQEQRFALYTPHRPLGSTNQPAPFAPALTVGALTVYQYGHALVVYDPEADRHAWILNLGGASPGFKVDRWDRITGLASEGAVLRVTARTLDGPEIIELDLSGL